jgi:quinoprotein dehydrogenase-associated probable ABC transporter substrate-binding protein
MRVRLAFAVFLVWAGTAAAGSRELRVCADPNNLPFSNERREGFENRIAQLVADELKATVKYRWHPQRRGFIRRTLNARECDVVITVPTGHDDVLATKPYYASSYVFVYLKSRNLQLRSFDDPVLRRLTIGLHGIGDDGVNPPPAHALASRRIVGRIVGFKMWDEAAVRNPQGKIIDAVVSGDIDVAIVWGPLGGYFGKRQPVALEVVPVPSDSQPPLPFAYEMSMGVREGDNALKAKLERVLDQRRDDIQKILSEYAVPIVTVAPPVSQR